MNPTNTEAAQIVFKELDQVPPILDEVMDKAVTLARSFFEQRVEPINPYLFPSLVRYFAKILFDEPYYKSVGYALIEISNNGLFLVYTKENKTRKLRVLKSDEGGIPILNLSRTKKDFYKQRDPFPFLPGMGVEQMEQFVSPDLLKLLVLWDVDENYIYKGVQLVCPKGESSEAYFADDIPHAATTITVNQSFDDVSQELEDIDIEPLEKTGTEQGNDDYNGND